MSDNSAGYSIDLEALENLERRLAGFVDFYRDQVDAVDRIVGATSAQWRGAAADAYQTSQADWTGRAREVLRHLEEIRQRIATARAAYQGANEANGKMFR
ncbi:WXG100 family type VII secretion target [Nocardia amikacinitolerans]|uniref:WXG100 family type VII secretion target n=1 Tax=Nocardia amikacinitolerans TaxID=756689 RepID=UPI0020A5EAFB|nr:WXG100 family type VII secretion target [Nocardia amikacinitolerans]MCP2290040.1 WXG100 family type VII secretion target [Nocardia amikacinitolerans]